MKFQTFEHFQKLLPDAKFNPKYQTCLEFSGRYGNPRFGLTLGLELGLEFGLGLGLGLGLE